MVRPRAAASRRQKASFATVSSMTSEDPTSYAADLAEQILDEISSADQNWRVVAACARELADLADRWARRLGSAERSDP